jgi:hypothetical protein
MQSANQVRRANSTPYRFGRRQGRSQTTSSCAQTSEWIMHSQQRAPHAFRVTLRGACVRVFPCLAGRHRHTLSQSAALVCAVPTQTTRDRTHVRYCLACAASSANTQEVGSIRVERETSLGLCPHILAGLAELFPRRHMQALRAFRAALPCPPDLPIHNRALRSIG